MLHSSLCLRASSFPKVFSSSRCVGAKMLFHFDSRPSSRKVAYTLLTVLCYSISIRLSQPKSPVSLPVQLPPFIQSYNSPPIPSYILWNIWHESLCDCALTHRALFAKRSARAFPFCRDLPSCQIRVPSPSVPDSSRSLFSSSSLSTFCIDPKHAASCFARFGLGCLRCCFMLRQTPLSG